MDHQTSLSRYILVVLAISVVFTTLVLVALNAWVGNNNLSQLGSGMSNLTSLGGKTYDQGYQDGYNAALEKARTNPTVLNNDVRSLSADIVSIGQNSVSIKRNDVENAAAQTATITASTTILLRTALSQEEFDKQRNEWQKTIGTKLTPPPLGVVDEPATINTLQAGDKVIISSDQSILDATSFDALLIIISR